MRYYIAGFVQTDYCILSIITLHFVIIFNSYLFVNGKDTFISFFFIVSTFSFMVVLNWLRY